MVLAPALSALTLAVSLGFAVHVARRWRDRRRPHQLLWAAALGLFALASGLEVLGALQGWSEGPYKVYFVITAVMVGLMAAGTGEFASRRLGGLFLAWVLVMGQALAFFAFVTPADAARLAQASAAGGVPTRVLGPVGILHVLIDLPAALLLIVNPLRAWRVTKAPYGLLLSAGALVFTLVHLLPSGGQSGLLSLAAADVFAGGTLVGLLLMLAGYLKSAPAAAPAEDARAVPAHG